MPDPNPRRMDDAGPSRDVDETDADISTTMPPPPSERQQASHDPPAEDPDIRMTMRLRRLPVAAPEDAANGLGGGSAPAEAAPAPARRQRRPSRARGSEQVATVADGGAGVGLDAPAPVRPRRRPPSSARVPKGPEEEALARAAAALAAEAPAPAPRPDRARSQPSMLPEELPRTVLGQPVGLRLDGVGRVFKAGEVEVRALDGVSLEIAPGEFVAVMGPSGCGKSTLLSLLGGLDRPSSGHVYAAGAALDQLSEGDLADYRLQRVGTVFQTFNLVASLSAEGNVALPLALAGRPPEERRRRAGMLLEMLGMEDRAGLKPNRLSGGEQQRVAIGRALANRPGLILADEPTGNLDSRQGELVLDLLQDLHSQGVTVVLVTHDPAVAARADRIIRLQDGRLVRSPASRRRTARAPESLDPPSRLSRTDAVRMGLGGVGRRPLRSTLTAGGVALGIGVMALILALASGVQAEAAAAATDVRLQQVIVRTDMSQAAAKPLGQPAVDGMKRMANVQTAWGQVAMQGGLAIKGAAPASQPPPSVLASLPPRDQWGQEPAGTLVTGRLPARDSAAEVVVSAQQARRLGLQPFGAVGRQVDFAASASGLQQPGTDPEKAATPVAQTLTIVGVSAEEPLGGSLPGGWVPYGTATGYWAKVAGANAWKGSEFQNLVVRASDSGKVDAVRTEVRQAGYLAQSLDDRLRTEQQHLFYLQLALVGLALIAVLVAFLGIANSMYTAVMERTTEVGVLKALGARQADVRLLFTAEAALIGAISGMAGVLLAAILARAGNAAIERVAGSRGVSLGLDLFQLQVWIWILAIALAVVFSALSGMLPASRAARLEPVRALRRE